VSAVPIEVQDHHAVEGYAERLLLAQRMSTGRSAIATPHNIPAPPAVLRPPPWFWPTSGLALYRRPQPLRSGGHRADAGLLRAGLHLLAEQRQRQLKAALAMRVRACQPETSDD
jgi:hypothetical protein